jgi:hypothetical protein
MVINLQFFGGRGGSSSLEKIGGVGLDVTYNGETTRYYFYKHGNQNYYSAGMGGMAEPTPQNMTPAEFKRRVESNGAKTAPVTAAMKRADEKKHAAYRKEMDTFLDRAYASDKTFVQGSRNARKANRANKRIRRR